MINNDYKLQLERIKQQLADRQYTEAWKGLEWLKGLKPTPLELNALEAKYYLETEDYDMVKKCLDGKWKPDYNRDALVEVIGIYEDLWGRLADKKEQARYHYMKQLLQYMGTDTEEWKECQSYRERLEILGQKFYTEGDSAVLKEMADIAYTMSDPIWYAAIQQFFCLKGISDLEMPKGDWIDNLPDMDWIKEQLAQPGRVMVLVAEEENIHSCEAMARLFAETEKQVYLVEPPKLWESLDENIVMADESFRLQADDGYGIHHIPSFFLEAGEGQRLDNRAAIIGSLLQGDDFEGLALVVGSGTLLNDLDMEEVLQKQYSRFNLGLGDIFESNMAIGWAGDYREYVSTIYGHDVNEWLRQKTTCRYSIVIPCENSAMTLQDTLKTCLELDYPKEQYEIVVSDNSSENDAAIHQLCQELNDSRIRYCRPPKNLSWSKNFEYAFLQTQGEFVFAIGADDGVLPWALQVLDQVREKYPQDPIIQWQRGFYAWPGFNGGQENQFAIPGEYKAGSYGEHYITRIQYMRELLQDLQFMYSLPMLYINSGCRRDYMQHILRETGRLWDGKSQDLYMGVINILVNNQILNLEYPLTIAGMAPKSTEKVLSEAEDSVQPEKILGEHSNNARKIGSSSMSMVERLFPNWPGSDISNLYIALLRAAARGVLPETYIWEIFDWEKMFWNCVSRLDARNPEFDKLIHSARYAASWHGEKFLRWFDDTIYEPIIQPTRYEEEKIEEIYKTKSYEEGEIEGGGLIEDASKHGVKNIYDAVQLFGKLSGLGKA